MKWTVPTLNDILEARRQITPYLRTTPLYTYPALSRLLGCEVFVKHENHQPICAFKVRGGVNLISQLTYDERKRGVIAASTGNHGQSIAYASRLFDVKAVICAPEGANPVKVESMRELGAEVILFGADYDEAREHCEALAEERSYRYIHSGNEPMLIAGVGTEALEILDDCPDVDVIIVPVGGGSGAAGVCIAAKGIRPEVQVIAVQSEAAPVAYLSWKAHKLLEDESATFAEGLSTRVAFELPQRILWDRLDDFVLVSESQLRAALKLMIEKTRNLVEAAGAAPLAAAFKLKERLAGRKVALICSGGNISPAQLGELFSQP